MPEGDRRYGQSHDDNDGKENFHNFIDALNQWKVNKNLLFSSMAKDVSNLDLIKQEKGITPQYQSCHTAVHQSGAVFEGHVPTEAMKRFIENPVNLALIFTRNFYQ
jgi:hypothetical protein